MSKRKDAHPIDEADLVAWTQKFVRFPSPQTELFEHEPQVQNFISECVWPLVRELDLPARRDPMGNLIVEIGPEGTDRSLILMAYAMTHPASRMTSPYSGELVNEAAGTFLRGRGISEQKGPLAAALAATKAAADHGRLTGRLVFAVSTAGETGRHDAAISILQSLGFVPRLGIIAIGTTGAVALANKGRVDVIVTVRGKAAHSSTPHAGVNAIDGARRVLDRVMAIDVTANRHPGLEAATLTATSIRSWPEATHTVQDEVRVMFDRRLLPGDDPQAAYQAIASAAAIGQPWEVSTEFGPFMYPAEIDPNGNLMGAISAGCRRRGLAHPATFYSHGALDAGYLCVNGCEATMWGPGDPSQWHSSDERIAVRELMDGACGYLGLIDEYLT